MIRVTVGEAKLRLDELFWAAVRGEEVFIEYEGKLLQLVCIDDTITDNLPDESIAGNNEPPQ